MCYCNHRKYAKDKNEIPQWEEGCNNFLNNADAWNYNFEKEYSKGDCEQSVLSQLIFIKLYKELGNIENAIMLEDGISICVEKGKKKKGFLFDVMNNPNSCQPHFQAECKNYNSGKMLFGEIYHTIGNFAPIPRTIITKYYGPNLQLIHRDLNELWPWLLKFLQDNWGEFPTKVYELMTFKEYMKYSCQQMYFNNIFDQLYRMYREYEGEVKWEKIIEQLTTKEISEEDTLISFNELFEENKIEEIDNQIKFLIELRGRYIISLLKKTSQTNSNL